ncbi:hypothetical protein [Salinibacter ruber]|uniref:Effector of murein hydrolase LrgA (UPF0299 family) n=1 Tax=Salinibacter ruber TaxID=146919 RepID=A0A9X2U2C2_9BACT|nr:hypothetical protein [Salinibacter ruber]MCS3858330.1 putative effector of murein hydrolase LrgA (UPF0299 family) [Salinibacter ruber]MCS3865157.1 putative effector of murein hydrolase LrgA (UPF0299 family) [Salinibacter ruber]MCS4149684.1 putative effector of murein hydrolase LrgA (UPF0299 family) [Salinibacter ruber]MCS4175914.1 putative effector of murein hydrolase LrgA (UPF0299 family) [Salinibacter ruber]
MGYIIFAPSLSALPDIGPFNEKRALQIGLLLAVGAVFLAFPAVRRYWLVEVCNLHVSPWWGLGLVLTGGVLSSLRAPATFYAFLEVGHFLLLFVMAGVIAAVVRRSPQQTDRWILGAVALSTMLYAVFFGVGYGMHLTNEEIKIWPSNGTNYANIRFFNHYQTWTLPLLGGILLSIPKDWNIARGGVLGLIALWWALIFASNVRGTIVAMGVAAVGVGLLFRRHAKPWLLVQAAGLLAGIGLYYLLFSKGGSPPVVEKFSEGGDVFQASPIMEDKPGDGLGTPLAGSRTNALRMATVPVRNGRKSP